ncbi:unannotated protein [freshwater metagenome]|uniref:Unannotated protein n=1 Tax=freshwater metagenome TaxID=449393 RepID=A0A6J7R9P8_9ZZZZ
MAIVTGGGRGLGGGVAARLASEGWQVVVADVREPELEAPGQVFVRCDVSREDEVAALMSFVLERHGRLDAVVNNAAIGGPSTTVAQTDAEAFRRVLEVNLVGPFLVCRAAVPLLIESAPGSAIVNVGSMFGQSGVARGAPYCASKGGVEMLTHSLALELAPHGIRVNTVAPGNMMTAMHWDEIEMRADEVGVTPDEMREQIRATIPLARHGTAADIAGAVMWLLGDDASYVTGQTISVNGGVLLS